MAAVHRVSVSGPLLAHILQDFGAAHGDCDGVLFGHLQTTISPKLEDDDDRSGPQEELTAFITGFCCSGSLFSFYDACGSIDPLKLSRIVGDREKRGGDPLIGWLLGRRNTPLRPSLRETAVTKALCFSHLGLSPSQECSLSPTPHEADGQALVEATLLKSGGSSPAQMLGSPTRAARSSPQMMGSPSRSPHQVQENQSLIGDKKTPINLGSPTSDIGLQTRTGRSSKTAVRGPCIPHSSPCLFMLLTESGAGHPVHTHEYRVYQYLFASQTFEPRTINIVNIGPAFRVQYDSFAPVSAFPPLFGTMEDESESNSSSTGLKAKRREVHKGSRKTHTALPREQAMMDVYAEGYKVERLAGLADQDGMQQVPELEDLYSKMLCKLEILAKQVCESSAALTQQENANKQLRLNAASLE